MIAVEAKAGRVSPALVVLAMLACCEPGAARELSREVLVSGSISRAPVDLGEYTPPPEAVPPRNRFEGSLALTRKGRNGFRSLSVDPAFLDPHHRDVSSLPEFEFEYVQDGSDLIPVRRGTIPGRHPSWELILEPGKAWDEPGDGGYSRASLPFALEERNANCMHDGVLTFLFKSDGAISSARWQVSSETCLYEKFDAWGTLEARYTPGRVADAARIVDAHRAEVAARVPVRPISALAQDHPGADPARFGSPGEVSPSDMTVYGFVIDGIHYVGGCNTRHGLHPFCDVLDLPSYSLAKSMAGGIGLMRLEALYLGDSNRFVRDHVPACATDDRWQGVTFGHTLDMATGLYRSEGDQADESAPEVARFFFPEDHESRIRYACREYARKAPPGTIWVYHTSDTYLLGAAMNGFLRSQRGASADFFRDLLADELWKSLKLSPAAGVTRRTYDAAAQPFTGYGLTLHRDDIVKLATFLSLDGGRIDGKQVLDPQMLRAALQRDPEDPGLRAAHDGFRYHNGFWAYDAARVLGCRGPVWVPYMSGFGGLQVVMFPNRTIYYYVSDGGEFRWAAAAAEANRIRRFCGP